MDRRAFLRGLGAAAVAGGMAAPASAFASAARPNFLVILVDDLRHDEFGAGGHPYMRTPHVDRLAREGTMFERAFHTTPICSPNRASILTGQFASRHGIIDNVARDAASYRLPNYHFALQAQGYETAHIGKWHMGNDGKPRPGYDHWIAFDGHGRLNDPPFNVNGRYAAQEGYVTDLLNRMAVEFIARDHERPWALWLAHKAVHPDAFQASDGTGHTEGYVPAARHEDLYRGAVFPRKPNMVGEDVIRKNKPAWSEVIELRKLPASQAELAATRSGSQEEIRLRACMMASVDEGVGLILDALAASGQLDRTCIVFLGDNGYFFGEHGIGPERRFPYEEGMRSPLVVRYPPVARAGARDRHLVIGQDLAPTFLELAGATPGAHVQGRSLAPLLGGRPVGWRRACLAEYWAESAFPWIVSMSYKAVRTERYKYIRWVNRDRSGELDELYDLERDPFEVTNVVGQPDYAAVREDLRRELRALVADAHGL